MIELSLPGPDDIAPLMGVPIREKALLLDFSVGGPWDGKIDLNDTAQMDQTIFGAISDADAPAGIGGYLEHRFFYQRSNLYAGEEARCIHLGIDIWMPEGTPVHAPLDGTIHSFQDNEGFGNYGPTIILQHEIKGNEFYTLYGHLSRESIEGKAPGQALAAGQRIGELGDIEVNGEWPAHLHFQAMLDMGDNIGDFPGVCTKGERETYTQLCPDPTALIQ